MTLLLKINREWLIAVTLFASMAHSCPSQKSQSNEAPKTSTVAITPTPFPTREWRNFNVSEESLLKAAIKRVYPTCPPQVRCAGKVKVRIAIRADEGIVTEAIAQDVHPLLRESVETAARAWRFKPSMDIDFVLVRGNLVFDLGATDKAK